MTRRPQGLVLYSGPSRIEPAVPIVVIATGLVKPSANLKTGRQVQVFVMRADVEPHTAVSLRLDSAVCGLCELAGGAGCYVDTSRSVLSVYRAWTRGLYPAASRSLRELSGRNVRIGAYGDPAAMPVSVVRRIAWQARRWTAHRFSAT